MQHDMAITKTHAIFLDPPLIFKPERMLGSRDKMPFEFDRNRKARFGVIDREATKERDALSSSCSPSSSAPTDSTRWFELDSCMFFHVANCWEDEASGTIKLFLCVFEDFDLDLDQVKPAGDGETKESSPPSSSSSPRSGYARLNEVTLDLRTGLASRRVVDPTLFGDFPRINEKFTGVHSKFAYVATMDPASPVPLFDGGEGDFDLLERKTERESLSLFLFLQRGEEREREKERESAEERGKKLTLNFSPFSLSPFGVGKKTSSVSKVDLLARDPSKAVVASFKYGKGRHGGEATFVADPHRRRNGGAEDAGFLVTFVFDEATRKSELLVLDAQDLSNSSAGFRVPLPVRVPYGFHVVHVVEEELRKQEGLSGIGGGAAREE